jgi:hypothetical protein
MQNKFQTKTSINVHENLLNVVKDVGSSSNIAYGHCKEFGVSVKTISKVADKDSMKLVAIPVGTLIDGQ